MGPEDQFAPLIHHLSIPRHTAARQPSRERCGIFGKFMLLSQTFCPSGANQVSAYRSRLSATSRIPSEIRTAVISERTVLGTRT